MWLTVHYPPTYPFFPPSVADTEGRLALSRHREPITGRLCLVHSRDWRMGTTAAGLIEQQLPRLLQAATVPDQDLPAGLEVPVPEPVGIFLPWSVGGPILLDTSVVVPPACDQGLVAVRFNQHADGSLGAGVLEQLTMGTTRCEPLPDRLCGQFPRYLLGRWTRWNHYEPGQSAEAVWASVEPTLRPWTIPDADATAIGVDTDPALLGLLVPSETSYRERGEEWIFIVRQPAEQAEPETEMTGPVGGGAGAETGTTQGESTGGSDHGTDAPKPTARWRYEFRRAGGIGRDDVAVRSPATRPLADRVVMLVGVGALGSTVAGELARAGIGRLDLFWSMATLSIRPPPVASPLRRSSPACPRSG